MTMATTPPRHVLVVAAQCGDARLVELEDTARALHEVLVDPDLGACLDRGEHSLLIGDDLGKSRVHEAVERAADAARRDGGVLVLALLGHGQGAEGAPLHFVTSGTRNSEPLTNVNVPSLLGDLCNHPGLAGLIVIVDTCLAGGAIPSTSHLTAGVRAGNVRLSLLFGASAKEPAYDLQLSRHLIRLIRDGVPDAGQLLKVDDHLMKRLREQISGQLPGRYEFDGAARYGEEIWLARNRAVSAVHDLGPISIKVINDAARRHESGLRFQTEEEFVAWTEEHLDTTPAALPYTARRLLEVRDELEVGRKTLNVMDRIFGPSLTEDDLRLAGMLSGLPLDLLSGDNPVDLRLLVEYCTHYGRSATGEYRALAHLAAALTHVTRQFDTPPEDLAAWAHNLRLNPAFNSRLHELNQHPHADRTPRLILVLEDDGGESIVRVDAWLLYGRAVITSRRFPCGSGERGFTTALADAVAWSRPRANIAKRPLTSIDVAEPTLTLLENPPEEQAFRKKTALGVQYTVTTRWSGLLTPPYGTTVDDMLQVGEHLLAHLNDTDGCSGPHWLSPDQLRTVEHVQEHLSNHGLGQQAWAVPSLPESDWVVIAQELLEHTPALIWPRGKGLSDEQRAKRSVARYWRSLPQQVAEAYRQNRKGSLSHDDDLAPLAAVRAAWHDRDWQAFCRRRAHRVLSAPEEVTYKE